MAHEVDEHAAHERTQLRYAAGERRVIVTCDTADFMDRAAESLAANLGHAGIVLVPPTFRTDEIAPIADAVEQVAREYSDGIAGAVVFVQRSLAALTAFAPADSDR